jgi:hypothetical protein
MFLTSTVKPSYVENPAYSLYEGIIAFQEEFADLQFENMQLEHEFLLKQANGYLSEADEEASKEEIKKSDGGIVASIGKFVDFIIEKAQQAYAYVVSLVKKAILKVKEKFSGKEVLVQDTKPEETKLQQVLSWVKGVIANPTEHGGALAIAGAAAAGGAMVAWKKMSPGSFETAMKPFETAITFLVAEAKKLKAKAASSADATVVKALKATTKAIGDALGKINALAGGVFSKLIKSKPADGAASKETSDKPAEAKAEDKKE